MPKYEVQLWRAISIQSTTIEVEAENKEAAKEAAIQLALTEEDNDDFWGDEFRADPYPEVSYVKLLDEEKSEFSSGWPRETT